MIVGKLLDAVSCPGCLFTWVFQRETSWVVIGGSTCFLEFVDFNPINYTLLPLPYHSLVKILCQAHYSSEKSQCETQGSFYHLSVKICVDTCHPWLRFMIKYNPLPKSHQSMLEGNYRGKREEVWFTEKPFSIDSPCSSHISVLCSFWCHTNLWGRLLFHGMYRI